MNELPSASAGLQTVRERLEANLDPTGLEWWRGCLERVDAEAHRGLPAIFPGLRRRAGAASLVEPGDAGRFLRTTEFVLDLAAYRRADAAAALLFDRARRGGAEEELLVDLFEHGDVDERVCALRCLPLLRSTELVRRLAAKAQRSNTLDVVEAAFCDHDAMGRHLDEDDFNRMVLKLAFADVPFWRVLGGLRRANPELSRMLQEFATEREAAGRPVWESTLALIARSPVDGTIPRLLGGLEHGRDSLRLAAVEALGIVGRSELRPYLEARLKREIHAPVRTALVRALAAPGADGPRDESKE